MSNKYFSGRRGHYIYCDICGQACYADEATKLKPETGRGGLLVCPNDVDSIDYGLIPYVLPNERPVKWAKVNHTDVSNGAAPLDIESTSGLGV
jgi:hypothetical protein